MRVVGDRGGVWQSEDGGLDAALYANGVQLLPLQGRDKLAKGWGTVGWVVVGVEEIEGSKESSFGVAQCDVLAIDAGRGHGEDDSRCRGVVSCCLV